MHFTPCYDEKLLIYANDSTGRLSENLSFGSLNGQRIFMEYEGNRSIGGLVTTRPGCRLYDL